MPKDSTYICPQCGAPVSGGDGAPQECPNCKTITKAASPSAKDAIPDTLLAPARATAGLPSSTPRASVPGYEILEELGRGGMGVVYKARHIGLNRTVALKMILSAEHAGKEAVARFRAEAEAVAQLKHPNIIQVYDIGEQDGRPYFSMEFVEGGSLQSRIGGQPQPPKWCAEIAEKLALAMHVAHAQGIIHRDLKPANVLLTTQGDPKIMDFGLAKRVESGEALTQSGAVMGTPQYMAPEQASGEARRVGPPADVYALGAILYAMLTGRPPFSADTALGVLRKVLSDEPTPPTTLHGRIPPDLETICLKCLRKEPQRRYASAQELAADLRRFLNHEPIVARPTGTWERAAKWARRRPAAAALVGVSALALVALVGGGVWYNAQLREALQLAKDNQKKAREETKQKEKERQKTEEQRRAALAAQQAEERQRKRAEEALATAERNNYFNLIALAGKKIEENEVLQARELLASVADSSARNWEWGRLLLQCDTSLLTLKGHAAVVSSVAFSPDGKRVATGSGDRTARVWDSETGRELLTLKGHDHFVMSVAFSPDGKRLATGSMDCTAKVWEAETGRELVTLRGHTSHVLPVAFSPDGKRVATGSVDYTAKVWEAETGREMLAFKGHPSTVSSVVFSPDGKRLATGSCDKTAKVWGAETGRELLTLRGHTGVLCSVAFSPDGKRLATGSCDKTAKVWDAEMGSELLTLKGHTQAVSSVAISPDGKRLATGSEDKTAKVWDSETGRALLTLKGHVESLQSVAFSPEGKRLATGSGDKTAKVWEAETGREVLTLKGHAEGVNSVAFSPDCKRLATGSSDGTAEVWDAESGRELFTLKGHTHRVNSVAFSPGGKRVATGRCDRTARVWGAETGRELLTLRGHTGVLC
ncbi:MAG: protein kinase, partial [Planctomycetota bacterium]|nr:protein kinase [Planctomycetota bacterium]